MLLKFNEGDFTNLYFVIRILCKLNMKLDTMSLVTKLYITTGEAQNHAPISNYTYTYTKKALIILAYEYSNINIT
jgi:hypothetical protein